MSQRNGLRDESSYFILKKCFHGVVVGWYSQFQRV